MDTSFWIERWNRNQIGFHQADINPYLKAHWSALGVTSGTVFVPLCGKSRDMAWLRMQGHQVVGVEVSRQAVSEFFSEQQLEPQVSRGPRFEVWQAAGYRLLCGDVFALEAEDLQDVSAVFDRAALIALPAELRQSYADKLQQALPPRARTLLVALTYPQEQMSGPPYAVTEAEVRHLYSGYNIEKLCDEDVLLHADNLRFKERGLRHMSEQVYLLHSR
jgi:thiopurine S-methyltransferase